MTTAFLRFLRGNTIAILALFVALGGTTYAATSLPKNSVGSKQLKSNAVTTAKIKKNAVTGSKIADNSVKGADVLESSLGKVPAAANADHATAADSATTAANATNAATVGGLAPSAFVQKAEVLTGHFSCAGTAWENAFSTRPYSVNGSLKFSTDPAGGLFRCSVAIPDGATVTATNFAVADASATEGMSCEMWRTNTATGVGGETQMAGATTTAAATPGNTRITDTTITQPIIDNDNFAYFVQCNTGTNGNTGVFAANVTYTLTGGQGATNLKPSPARGGSIASSSSP
jgi:hypothetical protein